jgi:hypothetical protein
MYIDNLVDSTVANINKANNVAISPIIIQAITEIILWVIEQRCKNVNRPSLIQRFLLKRELKNKLDRNLYKAYGTDVYNGLLRTASNLTKDELDGLYRKAND